MESGKVIQLLRMSLGLSIADISDNCRISERNVADIENNTSPITQSLIEYYAIKLSLPIYLLEHIFSDKWSDKKSYECCRFIVLNFLGFYLTISLRMAPNNESSKAIPNSSKSIF
jgi:transcriptional regulator with XRE-family HTH domain|tara:strand:- start:480 stop:824 length:345 start_codon:yes stop_codon:yes gene_type:complete